MEINVLIIVSMLIALVLTLLFGVVYIDFLKKKMFTQYVLEDAPENHAKKNGTPTTGGVFMTVSLACASITALTMNRSLTTEALMVLITLLFFMLTGLKDDWGKIKNKENKAGLSPRNKLFLQTVISVLPAVYVTITGQTFVSVGHFVTDIPFLYPIFAVLLIVFLSNAVNLTDGIDGLASSNIAVSAAACTVICILTGRVDLAIISAAAVGSAVGFLYFNRHPARVFMGDTGSLAYGGLFGTIAVTGKFELWIFIICLVFCCEILSVIIQVTSFKLTGKRVFKMSPIHHHFELCGWSENKIVAVFTAAGVIACTLTAVLFYILL